MTSVPESISNTVVAPPERLGDYCVDGVAPKAAVFPGAIEAISRVLSLATGDGKNVAPWGGGTQTDLGNVPRGVDVVLGLGRLDHMLFHEPADLVASVEAGMTLAGLQGELARKGQFLPLEAPLPSRATIGGILAANTSGPSRLAYGTPRDWLIGIKVVQANGVVTKAGGRVVKNVTGYDLNKLYVGSLGTLGVIVEANFKVAPLPRSKMTTMSTYLSMSAAVESAREVLSQSPAANAVHVVNRQVMSRLPGVVMGERDEAGVVALFFGREAAVKRRVGDATHAMKREGATAVESLFGVEGDSLWQGLTDLGWDQRSLPALLVTVATLPSHVEDLLATAELVGGPAGAPGIVADVGSGLVRAMWWTEEGGPGIAASVRDTIRGLREAAHRFRGHAVVERCPLDVKSTIDVWDDSPEGMAVMRRIKQELDPAGILNPGRFAGGI